MADVYNALAGTPVPVSNNALAGNAPAYTSIRDLEKYANLVGTNKDLTADYKPLNFEKLIKAGAFRVTHRGLDEGYDPDPTSGFSLVSAYNDAVGPQTRGWKDNPMAYPVVQELFTARPADIGAHKYLQIVESARDLGLTDKDIFMPRKKK